MQTSQIKIQFKSAASKTQDGCAYGFGRVYHELTERLQKRDDIQLVSSSKDADIQVVFCLPEMKWQYFYWYGFDQHPNQVIYTMWETTQIPYGWKNVINSAKALFTTSNWCKKVFGECGVDVPIYNVPHGVNAENFPYHERDFNAKPFTYLWQGMHPADRKGLPFALQAFLELDLPDAFFVQKVYPVASREIPDIDFREFEDPKNIKQITRFLPKEEYFKLMHESHVSVNPYQGEGFGMMPLETAATGMPTIATDWSGPTDYLNDECFRPLKYRLCDVGDDYISRSVNTQYTTPPAQDAVPSIADLKEAMLYFYENREACAEMGRKAARYIEKNWTWDLAADAFVNSCYDVLESS